MDLLSAIWLPITVVLFLLAVGAYSWFIFVRSIDIPWDDRNKKNKPGAQSKNTKQTHGSKQ